jgi:hypothetical protein
MARQYPDMAAQGVGMALDPPDYPADHIPAPHHLYPDDRPNLATMIQLSGPRPPRIITGIVIVLVICLYFHWLSTMSCNKI